MTKYIFILMIILSSCVVLLKNKTCHDYIMFTDFISGRDIAVKRNMVFKIDSLYSVKETMTVISFDMVVKSRSEKEVVYSSIDNKLTGDMKSAIIDDPVVEYVVFKEIRTTSKVCQRYPDIKVSFFDLP